MDQSATRPAGLYVVGVGTLLFGLLGLCTQGFGIFSAVQQREQMAATAAFVDDESMRELVSLQEASFLPTMISNVFGVLLALVLLVFGALVLAKVRAALAAPGVLIGAIAVELMQLAVAGWIQFRTAEAVGGAMGGLGAAGDPSGIGTMMSAAMGIGICIYAGWALAKCAFFGAGAAYLRKPDIRALFGGPQALSARGD